MVIVRKLQVISTLNSDLNTYFQGYLPSGTRDSVAPTSNLFCNSKDLSLYFKSNLVLTSGNAYNYRTKINNYNIYYFKANATFNYYCNSTLYVFLVGGGGGSSGTTTSEGGGGGGGGGTNMFSITSGTSGNKCTFLCGKAGDYGNITSTTTAGGDGGNSFFNTIDIYSQTTTTNTAPGGKGSALSKGGGAGSNTIPTNLPNGVSTLGSSSSGSDGSKTIGYTPSYPSGFTLVIDEQMFFVASGGQGGFNVSDYGSDGILSVPNNGLVQVFSGIDQKVLEIDFSTWGGSFGGEADVGSAFNGLDGTGGGGGGQRGSDNTTLYKKASGLKGGSGGCIVFFEDNS